MKKLSPEVAGLLVQEVEDVTKERKGVRNLHRLNLFLPGFVVDVPDVLDGPMVVPGCIDSYKC